MRRLGTVLFAIALALAACGNDEPTPPPPPDGPTTFKVMTQNLYLGGELDPVITATNLPQAVQQIWESVQATDFNERAKVIAAGIQAADLEVVGLQEVSLWRTETPGDHSLIPNATKVEYDFLDILMRELAARGLSYSVAATVQNGDIELAGTSGTDYRLTDRDAILAKTSLPVTSTASGTYLHLGTIVVQTPIGPVPVPVPRGWVAIEFAGGKTIRAVNTHLEAFSEEVAAQQAIDLIGIASPGTQPTIVLGDMNLAPGSAGYGTFLAGTGLSDTWADLNGTDPGFTCCWNADLKSGAFTTRIDLVFATASPTSASAVKVNEGTERTPMGLAPSDHAGVVVGFTAATSATMPLASR
jgi:endonuclease/exonuclease/phosphatase family metal-dependent hydrolase